MWLNGGEDNGVRLAVRTSQDTARIARNARYCLFAGYFAVGIDRYHHPRRRLYRRNPQIATAD
jgi:hypothetical protein